MCEDSDRSRPFAHERRHAGDIQADDRPQHHDLGLIAGEPGDQGERSLGGDAVGELREYEGRIVACGPDEPLLEWATRMLMVSRALERIGDQAVDIGEQVVFLVTGAFQEFDETEVGNDLPGDR